MTTFSGRRQSRRRVIDSLLIILFVFRLAAAGRSQGYRAMLLAYLDRGLNCVFRLQRNAAAFDALIDSSETDATIELGPPRDSPQTGSRRVRLIKYLAADTEFRLATTLLEERKYPVLALAGLYRGCWEIEEFRSVAKELFAEFRGRTECGVKQELSAAFTPITVTCLFTNRCDADANRAGGGTDMRAIFKNGLCSLGREIEAMYLAHGAFVADSVVRIMTGLSRYLQRELLGRSYPRASKKPRSKWMKRKPA